MALKQSLDLSRAGRERIDAEWTIARLGGGVEKSRHDKRADTERPVSQISLVSICISKSRPEEQE